MSARLVIAAAILLPAATIAASAQSQFESSKLAPGVVLQGDAVQSPKLAPGVVLQGSALESPKLTPGIVLQGTSFWSSKISVGIVVNAGGSGGSGGNGIITRAPLTHW
jgi:hypothetical protein